MNSLFVKIRKKTIKEVILIFIFFIILVLILGLQLGYITLGIDNIISVLTYKILGINSGNIDDRIVDIVWVLRFPRLILAGCVGMGLTLSGLIMQAVVQNPLADPYILGVSSGASLGATSAIFLGVGSIFGAQSIGVCAFFGAFGVSLLVVMMSQRGSKHNAVKLLLNGMAVAAVCSSISGLIVYLGRSKEGMEAITYWMMGNVANAKLQNVLLLLAIIVIVSVYFSTQTRILNLMLMGNDNAMTLGVNLKPYIKKYLLINAIIVGFIVFNAGAIGFIGLIIPHILRMIYGSNHKKLLPVAVVAGGFIGVVMDILSRTVIKGYDIPLGVVFALVGAPSFVYLMIQRKYRFGGN